MTELDPTSKIGQRSSAKKPPARPVKPSSQSANTPSADRVTLSHKPNQAPLKTESAKTSGQIRDQLVSKFRDYLSRERIRSRPMKLRKKWSKKFRRTRTRPLFSLIFEGGFLYFIKLSGLLIWGSFPFPAVFPATVFPSDSFSNPIFPVWSAHGF